MSHADARAPLKTSGRKAHREFYRYLQTFLEVPFAEHIISNVRNGDGHMFAHVNLHIIRA